MEISKELLSEVLGYTPFKIDKIKQVGGIGLTLILLNQDGTVRSYQNIYELAHKCKEWAYNTIEKEIGRYYYPVKINTKNINIISGKCKTEVITYNRLLNANISGEYYCRVSESDNSGQYRTFIAETEVEAIIKACEFILKELNEK